MIIQCPTCRREREIVRSERGGVAECSCGRRFVIDGPNVLRESSSIDEPAPERIGPYRIERRIGCGGMSVVYRSVHPKLGIPVAVKLMKPEFLRDKDSLDRFERTARICARLNHPNVVRVYDFGVENGLPFLVMEILPGGSMHDMLQREGPLPHALVANAAVSVCLGLAATEAAGIVHRDIKPDNIMIDADGVCKISDLGLARSDSVRFGASTIPFSLLGTPEYMAPEQADDASACDTRADIYSLGVSMYQMATGRLPFLADTTEELIRKQREEEPVAPSALRSDLPLDFDCIVMRCIQKSPDDRYQTIAELLADLKAFLDGRTLPSVATDEDAAGAKRRADDMIRKSVATASAPRALRPVRAASMKRTAFRIGLAAILALLAGAILLWHAERNGRNHHTAPFPTVPPRIALPSDLQGDAMNAGLAAPPNPPGEKKLVPNQGLVVQIPDGADEETMRAQDAAALPSQTGEPPLVVRAETPFMESQAMRESEPAAAADVRTDDADAADAREDVESDATRSDALALLPSPESPADAAFRAELSAILGRRGIGPGLPAPETLASGELFIGLPLEERLSLRLELTKLKNAERKGALAKRFQPAIRSAIERLSVSRSAASAPARKGARL